MNGKLVGAMKMTLPAQTVPATRRSSAHGEREQLETERRHTHQLGRVLVLRIAVHARPTRLFSSRFDTMIINTIARTIQVVVRRRVQRELGAEDGWPGAGMPKMPRAPPTASVLFAGDPDDLTETRASRMAR